MLFAILLLAIKFGYVFGLSAIASCYILNILCIDTTYIILYLLIRKMYNNKIAIFSLVIFLCFLPILIYTPIFYSDTLSLPIGILFIYLFMFIKNNKRIEKKEIIISILLGTLLFLSKEIKITTCFIFVSIIFYNNFKISLTKNIKVCSIIFITFIMLSLSFNFIVIKNKNFAFNTTLYGKYPYTHWIMMGVEDIDADNSCRNSYGGYNLNDYIFSQSFKTGNDAMKPDLNEYFKRVSKMGIIGYPSFLYKKAVNAWGDGSYFSLKAISIKPKNENSFIRNTFNNYFIKNIILYYMQGIQIAFILLTIINSIYILRKKKKDDLIPIKTSIFMLFIFLLIWENRSRYLLNYIPLFIIIIINEINYLYNFFAKIKLKKH